MISSGILPNRVPFALLENDDERVLSIQITDARDERVSGSHIYHQKSSGILESFYKSDADAKLHIKLTFDGEDGKARPVDRFHF